MIANIAIIVVMHAVVLAIMKKSKYEKFLSFKFFADLIKVLSFLFQFFFLKKKKDL